MARGRYAAGGSPDSHNAPLEGRRVWDVGDWGNASGWIGKRWEIVGLDRLRQRLADGTLPVEVHGPAVAVVPFVSDEALQRRLVGLGLTNPDALLLYPSGASSGSLIARAVDFKWSIETANERQVSAATLEALFERIPDDLSHRIRRAYPDFQGSELVCRELVCRDGFFFAPRTRANEPARRPRWAPRLTSEVVFESVDGPAFFATLPGWAAARQLAALDCSLASLTQIDRTEHYYRLGVGISAARDLLERSIFDLADEARAETAPGDAAPLPLAEWGLPSSPAIVTWLSPRVGARKALTRRLREILRLPYSFRDLLWDVAGWRAPAAEPAAPAAPVIIPAELRSRWEPVYRRLGDRYRAALLQEGRDLARQLGSEAAALDQLQRRRAIYQRRVRRWVGDLATPPAVASEGAGPRR